MPGVIVGGAIGAAIGARRARCRCCEVFDCVDPRRARRAGRSAAGATRFNQELFGGPTDLPWGLEVDRSATGPTRTSAGHHVPPDVPVRVAWPTCCCSGSCYWLIRSYWQRVPAGTIFAAYLVGYGFVRFWVEGLRVDPAHEFGGMRLNQWVSPGRLRARRRLPDPRLAPHEAARGPPERAPAVRGERPGARGTERGGAPRRASAPVAGC